jgi:uncharacterized membrane protein YbaN (DUF454 family)
LIRGLISIMRMLSLLSYDSWLENYRVVGRCTMRWEYRRAVSMGPRAKAVDVVCEMMSMGWQLFVEKNMYR